MAVKVNQRSEDYRFGLDVSVDGWCAARKEVRDILSGEGLQRERFLKRGRGFRMQTLVIYKLGFNQNYYTFTLILLLKIVLRSRFS